MRSVLYISLLPVILLLLYVYKKDYDKEPREMLTRIFILGALTPIVALFLEETLDVYFNTDKIKDFVTILIYTFFGIGLPEELCKWAVTYATAYDDKEFNHKYDEIVYCVFASLGFAAIENILYVLASGYGAGIIRALTAVPSHACNAIIMGYFLGNAKEKDYQGKKGSAFIYKALSLIIPSIVHSLYDGLIEYSSNTNNSYIMLIFLIYVIITYIICFKIIKKTSSIKTNIDGTFM